MIFDILSAGCAVVAANFWYRSSRIKIPNLGEMNLDSGMAPFQESAKLSSRAALSAAFSALFQFASLLYNVLC